MNRYLVLVVMILMTAVDMKSQAPFAIPNEFRGYTLGILQSDFELKNKGIAKTEMVIPFTDIVTRGTVAYILKDQLTESKDKIDITFFFYQNLLSVIRVAYKTEQSLELFQKALKTKYGNMYEYDDKAYRDPSSGQLKTMENMYWKKSDCYILCLTSSDSHGLVYLTFADKAAQEKLKAQEQKRMEQKIQ